MDTRQFLRDIDDAELALKGLSCYVLDWFEEMPTLMEDLDAAFASRGHGTCGHNILRVKESLDNWHRVAGEVLKDLAQREVRLRDAAVRLSDVKLDEQKA